MWLLIACLVAMALVIFLLVPALVHRAAAPVLEKRIAQVYPADRIVFQDRKASSFGLESRGVTQARGNGALVLTATSLHWFQLVPEWDLGIPLANVAKAGKTKWHLGKSIGRDVLHVAFTLDGRADSMAWYVTDLEAWLSKLSELIR